MSDEEKKENTDSKEKQIEAHAEMAENWLLDFFMFRLFITRPFIKIIYILGALAITLLSLGQMFGIGQQASFSSSSLFYGFVTLILGNIGWRITCEIWIVFFRLHDIVKSIDNSLKEE